MRTKTTNGCSSFTTTNSSLLDLFGSIGASRNNIEGIKETFSNAFIEDPLKATAILLYARDIRHNGCGERQVFRTLVKELINKDKKLATKVCKLIPSIGRWDDMKTFFGTPIEKVAATLWADAILTEDVLASKWADRSMKPLQKAMNMNEATLRKTISAIRKKHIVEAKMCANEWNKIEYDKLPSICGMRNANAFKRHDEERYNEFINSKDTKVNASVAYPYDVYRMFKTGKLGNEASKYWENLPDLDIEDNILPIVDVSGSMFSSASGSIQCIDISISLGVYLAQHIKGKFQNMMMTFSEKPTLVSLPNTKDINELFCFTEKISWGTNTDIQKTYEEILRMAKSVGATQVDMPKSLLIISDMQFDQCTNGFNRTKETMLENMRKKFEEARYELPSIIFWQVNASYGSFPSMSEENGVCIISGFSPNIIKPVLAGEIVTPVDVMQKAIEPFIEMIKG